MSLGALGHLGTTLGSRRLTCAFQAAILEDFSSKWGPHSETKNHTGGFQVGIGACNDVFLEGLFQDLNFKPNQVLRFARDAGKGSRQHESSIFTKSA